MIKLDNIAEQLFNKIRGRFPKVTIGDSEGNVTNEPPLARYFDFDYTIGEDNSLGNVSISLDEEEGLVIMFSKDFVEGSYGSTKTDWYNFLKEMRQFSKKRLMKFEVRDINRSNLTRRDYQYLATNRPGDKPMSESKMYGTNKTSFQKIGNAKLSIKHSQPINIESANSRTGKIGSIFIESPDGEKFKYPFKHLSGARALARHVAEGGHAYDDFGKYISSLSEEMSKLRRFSTYMNRNAVMAETLDEYTGIVKERVNTIKKEIQNLQKESYYKTAVENFSPRVVEDVPNDIQDAWVDQLTIKQFNEELKDVFPYIYNLVGENTVKEIGLDDLIKESTSEAYTIKKGDTVYSISKRFNVSVEDIIEVNGLDDRATIYPGQQLILPGVSNPDSFDIGAGGTSGSTRGIDPKDNYSADDFRRLTTGEAVEHAIESLMGQFAESNKKDTDEGNEFTKALSKARANNDDEMEVDGKKIPVTEFILSYFDRHSGQFPKGETAVLTMVEKEYGEQYIRPAQAFIEQVNNKVAEVMGYKDNELEEDNIGEGFLQNLVGDVRNAFKPGVAVTPNMVKELEAGVAAIKAGGQPTPRQQKIFDRFMSDTLPKELQKMGINMNEDLSQNYENDAEAIKGLMAKSARSTEETAYLTMLARKYDFYGKPENIGPAIEKAEKAAAAAKPPRQPSGGSSGGSSRGYTPKDFPSMAAAMAKVDYYEPGARITINGEPYVRDVDEDGRKFFRPDTRRVAPEPAQGTPSGRLDTKGETPAPQPAAGTLSGRLDTKGQTPSRESVELNRIKGLAGL